MAGGELVNICFHGVGVPERELEPGEERYWISESRFLAILDEIADTPSVRVSFDDGNRSDVEIALPALTERGLTAEFFVLAGRLGQRGSLGEDEVRELRRRGMAVGSHGMHHRSWRHLDRRARHDELVVARQRLADVVGEPVDTAACPKGRYDRQLLADLRRLGYTRVYTSDRRRARPAQWLQPRYSVHHDDTPAALRTAVLARPEFGERLYRGAIGIVKRLR